MIGLGLLGIIVSYFGYYVLNISSLKKIPVRTGLLVAQDTGKTKHIQSKTGDASMRIELNRRRAIQAIGKLNPSSIKETVHQKGSTAGALESFFITAICPPLVFLFGNDLYDGGCAGDEYCEILQDIGKGERYDAGDATSKFMNKPIIGTDYDAGGANNDYKFILRDSGDGYGYDAGHANATYCCDDENPAGIDYDAGYAIDDYCDILNDGGIGEGIDAGNATTTVCGE